MSAQRLTLGTMTVLFAVASASIAIGQTEAASGGFPSEAPSAASVDSFTIISVEYLPAKDVDAIIRQMFPFEQIVLSPLPSTNQLIVRADERVIKIIEGLLMKIDKPARKTSAQTNGQTTNLQQLQNPQGDLAAYEQNSNYTDNVAVPASSVGWQAFSADYQNAESETKEVAKELREALKTMGKDHPRVVKLRAALEEYVNRLFQQRQSVHMLRIHELENKLQMLRRKAEHQQQSREQMVRQRIEQLMTGRVPSTPSAPRPAQNPYAGPINAAYTLSLNAPDRNGTLNLLAQLAEAQTRIARAEAEYATVAAEMKRAKDLIGDVDPEAQKSLRQQLVADARLMDVRRKASSAEIKAARRLHKILETQVAAHRDLLRNDLEMAQLALAKAERDLERASSLKQNNAISESALDSIQTTMGRTRLQFERAKRILDAFEEDQAK